MSLFSTSAKATDKTTIESSTSASATIDTSTTNGEPVKDEADELLDQVLSTGLLGAAKIKKEAL